MATPALAQDRGEPTDKLAPGGSAPDPSASGDSSGARSAPPPSAAPSAAPADAPPAPPAGNDAAPWSWPWNGAVRSPAWTQDENWVTTQFWLMDVGHVQLESAWQGSVERKSYEIDHYFEERARIGLLPHLELDVGEDFTLLQGEHVEQQGNEIGARLALWDYGTIPLNPAFEIVWMPRQNAPDAYEARGTLGGELFSGLFVVGNAFFQGETGADHTYDWGFRGGAAYELFHDVLRVGAEGGVQWSWDRAHDKGPFRDTQPSVGPSLIFKPLALIHPEWGHWAKITGSCEFVIRDNASTTPFMIGGIVLAASF
jgi:hypothetical protein